MKLTVLMVLSVLILGGCSTIRRTRIHYLDTQLKEMREYEVIDEENLVLSRRPKAVHKMAWGRDTYGNGFMCIPPEDAQRARRACLERKCTSSGVFVNDGEELQRFADFETMFDEFTRGGYDGGNRSFH